MFGLTPAVGRYATTPSATDLTAREREILRMVGRGHSNGEVADRLGLSVETVKSHVRRVLGKLGARNRCHAVALAYEYGVFTPGGPTTTGDDPPADDAPPDESSPPSPGRL